MTISTEFVTVTPALAREWLGQNTQNRNVKASVVKRYASDMRAGRWTLTGAPIQFSKSGKMQDGQHRLLGVIEANAPVTFLVVRGLEEEAQEVMDIGAARMASDHLELRGYVNSRDLAATAKLLLRWQEGTLTAGSGDDTSSPALLEFIHDRPGLSESVRFAKQHGRFGLDIPRSAIAAVHWRLITAGVDDDLVQVFFGQMATQSLTGPGDPRGALLRRVASARKERERIPQIGYVSALCRTWNDWISGRQRTKLSFTNKAGDYEIPALETR